MINGEESLDEGIPKLIAAKDRVLQNELERYNEIKAWAEALPT